MIRSPAATVSIFQLLIAVFRSRLLKHNKASPNHNVKRQNSTRLHNSPCSDLHPITNNSIPYLTPIFNSNIIPYITPFDHHIRSNTTSDDHPSTPTPNLCPVSNHSRRSIISRTTIAPKIINPSSVTRANLMSEDLVPHDIVNEHAFNKMPPQMLVIKVILKETKHLGRTHINVTILHIT
ncbi:unnamed protein product, partial [Brassica oleracea var. botrytis]